MKSIFTLFALISIALLFATGVTGEKSGAVPEKFKGMTEAHNRWRAKVNVGPLTWSPELAAYAQNWADTLKNEGCRMKHRQPNKYGENLAWASGKNLTSEEVTDMWGDEIKNYNYTDNSCSGVCGHYTQVVWKSSLRVGCGMAECGNSEIWVCNYDPPGNWVGKKPY